MRRKAEASILPGDYIQEFSYFRVSILIEATLCNICRGIVSIVNGKGPFPNAAAEIPFDTRELW